MESFILKLYLHRNLKGILLYAQTVPLHIRQTDDELLILLQKGNERAFTAIYERYHKLLYVLAYKYLKDNDTAKDAVQQIFLKLWESRSLFSIHINLRNYLYTMLKNHLLNEIRNNYTALEKNYELAQETTEYENRNIIETGREGNDRATVPGHRRPAGTKESSLPVQAERQFIQSGNRRKNADLHTDCQNSLLAGYQAAP